MNRTRDGWKQAIESKTIAHERGSGQDERVRRGGWEEARPGFPSAIQQGHTVAPKGDKRFGEGRTGLEGGLIPRRVDNADGAPSLPLIFWREGAKGWRSDLIRWHDEHLVFIDDVAALEFLAELGG